MWKRLSLRARLFLLLAALVLTTLLGGLVTVWHTRAMDSLLVSLIDKNVASFQAAEELEASLLHQKGFLTYFFLDGNPDWLRQMEQHQQEFSQWLQKARKSAYTEAMEGVLRADRYGVSGLHQIPARGDRSLSTRGSGSRGQNCTGKCAASSLTC